MGGKMSRNKGKRGEREFSKILNKYGHEVRRSQQYCGEAGDADLTGMDGIHWEVKRVEKLNMYSAIEQAIEDAVDGDLPIVAHRRNHKPWIIAMEAEQFITIFLNPYLENKDGE